ncbi:hypothetical protein GALMADRAFT_233836 [Galerina marginata CBS 339.88]|uniref:SCP domain-containing protein n=1 Tax=Galerina marginata (strain CBS 339.88) TaxID=685588 RepID=A0A067TS72_GALM3|nr:hypothetical protein GALMADRAFT_233836 [Galerina marginata CBS 339.88]
MARLSLFISLGLALSSLPSGLAGPACAKKHFQVANCIDICKSKWGWTGAMMGTDRWGSVVKQMDTATKWDAVIAQACGSSAAITPTAASSDPTPVSMSTASPTGNVTPYVVTTGSASSATRSTTSAVSSPSASSSSSRSASATPSALGLIASVRHSSSTPAPVPTPAKDTTPQNNPPANTKPAAPAPAPPKQNPPPPPAGGSGGTSGADIQAYLSGHNTIRSQHGAAPLTWNNNLASKAQQWANGCKFQHSGGSLGPFGENLAAGTGSYGIAQAIKDWTDEVSRYKPSNPTPSHFTQVVWKASTEVGCAVKTCNGIFDASFGPAKYFVCEYSPQGNIIGRFAQNVQV